MIGQRQRIVDTQKMRVAHYQVAGDAGGKIVVRQVDDITAVRRAVARRVERHEGLRHHVRGERLRARNAGIRMRVDAGVRKVFGQPRVVVVGMRMHSLIMASRLGVPVIGIGITPKFGPLFRSIGQERYLLDVREADANTIVSMIQAAGSDRERIDGEMRSRVAALRKKARANDELVRGLLQ